MTISESQTSLKRLKNGSFAPASANGGQVVTDLTSPLKAGGDRLRTI